METVIYGASDDLLEISGVYSEEFGVSSDEKFFVAVSDGTLLEVQYEGDWRIRVKVKGSAFVKIEQSVGEEDKHAAGYEKYSSYSDLAIFSGQIKWVVSGNNAAQFK